jgi:ABC-2 type transport system permease protein
MRILFYIVQKEFLQIFRNKAILPLLTVIPIVQLILLSFAASNEIKNVNITIVDQDHSSYSRLLGSKIQASDRFTIVNVPIDQKSADKDLQSSKADVVLTIPAFFERDFLKDRGADLQVLVNAINGQEATIGATYLGSIIQTFNKEISIEATAQFVVNKRGIPTIDITHSNWYNPELDYKVFMVPGILGVLVTIIVLILTAMNVVREREIGTIEQINVSPIKNWQFILGKMLPFLVVGLVDLSVGLTVGKLVFDIPMVGSLGLVFLYCTVNVTAVLGMGLLISNFADTQQQAMFIAWFFMMIFILMSGLFTPIESMPQWAQWMTVPNPMSHFVSVMRQVLLKGSNFYDVQYQFAVTGILAIVFNTLAVWSYSKQE